MARWRPRPRTDAKAGRGLPPAHHWPVRALECRGDRRPDDPSRLGKRRRGPPLRCGGAVANGGDYSVRVSGHAMLVTASAKQNAALRDDSAGAEGQGDSLAAADRGFGEIHHRYASRSARTPPNCNQDGHTPTLSAHRRTRDLGPDLPLRPDCQTLHAPWRIRPKGRISRCNRPRPARQRPCNAPRTRHRTWISTSRPYAPCPGS
jgi:hypothetical protein